MAVNAMTSRFGLAAVALLAVVPFLWPSHVLPIPSFHEEWLAALLGLAASVALIGARRLPLPGAALLALALGGMALSQMAFGRAPVPELATLFALYLFWAALLACVGSHLADVFGRARLTRVLASAILAGALLCALAGLFQPWLQQTGWPGFPSKMGGPLGQANHFTSYLWLGLASALYLRTTAVLSGRAFWTAALLLTLSAVLAGQRSSFLYAVALIGIAVVEARMEGAPPGVRRLAMGIGLLFIFLQPISLLLPPMEGGEARPPPATRFLQHADRPSVRLQLWRVGAGGILAAPLLGNGIGSYPGLALTYADTIPPEENPGPSEHAHNLLIDLAAELGLPAALLVLLAGGAWLWRLPRRAAPAEAAWAAASIVILALHSMIEYPLWHTYFLGLLAVVAGAFGADRGVGRRLLPTALVLGLLLWGGLTLLELRRDYGQLEMAHALGKHPAAMPQAGAALLRISPTSLLAPWVSTTACVSLDPLRVPLADGLAVCRIGVAFAPTIESGVNMAVLLWRDGDTRGASDLLRRFRLASSQYRPHGLDALLAPLEAREARLRTLSEAGN
jgi:hypothetical protein